jgi:ATP-binding cassette subfamily G (WHITE) protein 2 (SNQ2)
MKTQRLAEVGNQVPHELEYATPLLHQFMVVQRRTNLAFWRSPNYGFTRLFNHGQKPFPIGFPLPLLIPFLLS